ncbi:MAG: phosphoglycerate kinase, partial [bacterium]|nr:phosphoglycerate kinase [bacterium]
ADIYVNDAFGVCHRAHASVVGIPKYLPSYAGFLLEKEINALSRAMENPDRPFVAIIGGVKFESKAKVIDSFLKAADYVLVGGKIGLSEEIKKINSPKIVLPLDDVDTFDIGPESIKLFVEKIRFAKTIVWAGPVGLFEKEPYNAGTKAVGDAIINNSGAFKVAGGGDTVSAINKFGWQDRFDHLSTGGGAMLDFIAGKKLPGLEALGYYDK